jgi:hypothetical protein
MKGIIILLALMIALTSANQCVTLKYLPMPKNLKCEESNNQPNVL